MWRDWRVYLAAGVVLAVAGGAFALLAPRPHQPPSLPRTAPSAAPSASALLVPPKVAAAIPRSIPVEIEIPSINVDAKIIPVGTDSSGALETPPLSGPQSYDAAWWDGGATPGQDGPSIIVGHIDSAAEGPLVFWNLHELVPGQAVEVTLADGAQVWFNVVGSQQVSKTDFPTQQVYGPTPWPTLRLITCTGDFDPQTGHYDDNLIVYLDESVASG
jgi:hypothetical protein